MLPGRQGSGGQTVDSRGGNNGMLLFELKMNFDLSGLTSALPMSADLLIHAKWPKRSEA